MNVQAINAQLNKPNFTGQLRLNLRNMDIIDVNLFKYRSSDIVEFTDKQKYDYKIEKVYNQIHLLVEKNGKRLAERLVSNYTDGNGHKHLKNVLKAIKDVTKEIEETEFMAQTILA